MTMTKGWIEARKRMFEKKFEDPEWLLTSYEKQNRVKKVLEDTRSRVE